MNIFSTSFQNITANSRLVAVLYPLGFLGLSTLFEALYLNIPENILKQFYLNPITSISAKFINFVTSSEKAFIHQNSLLSEKAYLEIAPTCSGSSILFFLVAAILIFSASVKHKIIGIILSLILVVFLNTFRIIGLYFVMIYRPEWFLPFHLYISPTLIIIMCCLFFAWWGFTEKAFRHD